MRRSHPRMRGRWARRGTSERPEPADAAADAAVAAFRDAYLAGDAVALARLLAPGVRVVVDTGGADGTPGPADGVTAAVTLLRVSLGAPATLRLDVRSVNGRLGLLASRGGQPVAVVVPEGDGGPGTLQVDRVWIVADPGKLLHW